MSLIQQITDDLKEAMKAKDQIRMSCLRMLKTALKNRQVEIGRELKDEEVQPVISSLIRKGQEAAQEFKQGGRDDLATKEEEEIKVFYGYLPQQLKPDEIAVLFIREGHMVQFPKDIEVFSVAPPALDEIQRWLRDHASANETDES